MIRGVYVSAPHLSKGWTLQRVTTLIDAWLDGLTASAIARRIGLGLTKDKVIGKAHRLRLPPRPSPIKRTPPAPRLRPIPYGVGTLPPLPSEANKTIDSHP